MGTARYKSVNLTEDQMERAQKLVDAVPDMNFNRMIRLFIDKAQPADVRELQER